jgi:hypothetical protein
MQLLREHPDPLLERHLKLTGRLQPVPLMPKIPSDQELREIIAEALAA